MRVNLNTRSTWFDLNSTAFAALTIMALFLFLSPSASASAETAETVLTVIPKDAGVIVFVPDLGDFRDYKKWAPIYDYIVSNEFGGIYLTENGRRLVEKIERAVKMPLPELSAIVKNEVAAWIDFGDFKDAPVNFALVFRTDMAEKLRSILDDNFVNNAPDSKSEKLGYCDYSYFVRFKFKNPFYAKNPGASQINKNEFIEGRFAVAMDKNLVTFASSKDYLQKMVEYSRAAANFSEAPFAAYFSACVKDGRTAIFANCSAVVSAGIKSIKDSVAALKEAGNDLKAGKNDRSATPERRAAQMETLLAVIETLGLQDFKVFFASHRLAENGMVMDMRFEYAREGALTRFAGPELDFMDAAKLCPADASSMVMLSVDFTAIISAVDAVFEKLPISSRAQYFMAKSAVLSATGMKLKEDFCDMFAPQTVFVNKIEKSREYNGWVARPTMIFKLKNPKAAEKLIARLTEQKLMTNFEVKEFMGKKYFSAPIPGAEKQVMCLMIEGDYLVFSMFFDHFTAVVRNISDPRNSLAGVKKFIDASKDFDRRAVYFIYTSDEDMAEYYLDANYGREDPAFGPNGFFARYDYAKINWEKVRRRQAPTIGAIRRKNGAFEGVMIGGFNRE